MQLLDTAIVITEIALAIALATPFIHSAIWVLSPIWTQPTATIEPAVAVPDLGAEVEGEALAANIDRVLHKPVLVVSVAQAVTEPVATLSVPAQPVESTEVEETAQTIHQQTQAIVESDDKPSNKLRRLARLYGVPRSSGGKTLRSTELRAALQPLVAVALP